MAESVQRASVESSQSITIPLQALLGFQDMYGET